MNEFTFTLKTIPGQTRYEVGTKDVRAFFFIAIITEGRQEEIQYLKGINGVIQNIEEVPFKLVYINELIKEAIIKDTYSNPIQRMKVLIGWRQDCVDKYGINPNDEDWLICDRDNSSFSGDQYDKLLATAKRDNFKVIVSNPAFQIWLLFHFVSDISPLNLNSMDKSSDRIAVVENELRKYVPDYVHGSLNMSSFGERINNAVENSKKYPADLVTLKDMSGTNFYELIERLNQIATIDTSVFSSISGKE